MGEGSFPVLKARPLLFTILGDAMPDRGGEIPLAVLYRLMAVFQFSPDAVRLVLTRMARQGWLTRKRRGRASFYTLTPQGIRHIDEGTKRIHKLRPESWDGHWRLLAYSVPERRRALRDMLRQEIIWLGYGALSNSVWICPYDRTPYVREVLRDLGLERNARFFTARYDGPGANQEIVRSCWDLESVAANYSAFLARFQPRYAAALARVDAGDLPDDGCFAERIRLVHEYRRFIFVDPGLPDDLCPAQWPGGAAMRLFHQYYTLLTPGARRFLVAVAGAPPAGAANPPDPFGGILGSVDS